MDVGDREPPRRGTIRQGRASLVGRGACRASCAPGPAAGAVTAARRYHPQAIRELYDAAESYEAERPGLGDRFGAEVEDILHLIAATPNGGTASRGTRARKDLAGCQVPVPRRLRDRARRYRRRCRRPHQASARLLAVQARRAAPVRHPVINMHGVARRSSPHIASANGRLPRGRAR